MKRIRIPSDDLNKIMGMLKTITFGEVGVLYGYDNKTSGYWGVIKFLKENGIDHRQFIKKSGGAKNGHKYGRGGRDGMECTENRPSLIRVYREGKRLIRVYSARYTLGIF